MEQPVRCALVQPAKLLSAPVCELLSHRSAVNVSLFGLAHMNLPAFLQETDHDHSKEEAIVEEVLAFGDMPFEARLQEAFHGALLSKLAEDSIRATPLSVQVEASFRDGKWIANQEYMGPEVQAGFE